MLPGKYLFRPEHTGNGHIGQQARDHAPLFDFHAKQTFLNQVMGAGLKMHRSLWKPYWSE